jgi:hypothetical protein
MSTAISAMTREFPLALYREIKFHLVHVSLPLPSGWQARRTNERQPQASKSPDFRGSACRGSPALCGGSPVDRFLNGLESWPTLG